MSRVSAQKETEKRWWMSSIMHNTTVETERDKVVGWWYIHNSSSSHTSTFLVVVGFLYKVCAEEHRAVVCDKVTHIRIMMMIIMPMMSFVGVLNWLEWIDGEKRDVFLLLVVPGWVSRERHRVMDFTVMVACHDITVLSPVWNINNKTRHHQLKTRSKVRFWVKLFSC